MDKWDENTDRIKRALAAQEPDAALAATLQFFAELGRTVELVGEDVNRIASALEKIADNKKPK